MEVQARVLAFVVSFPCCLMAAGDPTTELILEQRAETLESLLKIYTAIVVLGLIYEYGYALLNAPKAWPPSKRWPFKWAAYLEKLGAVLVVVGVAGELYVEVAATPVRERLRELNEERSKKYDLDIATANASAKQASALAQKYASGIANADARAAEAGERAAEASERAKSFEAQIATANAVASTAQLELARLKTPRRLSAAQKARIKSKIKPFTGKSFDLYVSGDSESVELMDVIDALLRDAGWIWSKAPDSILFGKKAGIVVHSGVAIEISRTRTSELAAACVALRDALISEGIETVAEANLSTGKNADTIHVIVGSKPIK